MDSDRSQNQSKSNKLSKGISRLLKFSKEPVNEQDILQLVENRNSDIEDSEREIISNVFEWTDTAVSEVMTHRTDIIGVAAGSNIADVAEIAIKEGYSRIPVFEKDIDKIVGIINVKDLLCLIGQDITGKSVEDFMREVKYISAVAKCKDTFEQMRKERTQFAVVIDEYGGTEGIITIEDLLEELVGNIQDEYDDEEDEITESSENVFTIDGTASPDDVFEELEITPPENNEYATMNAFFIDLLGKVPEDNEEVKVVYENVEFTALKIEDNFIEKIEAVKNENSD